jgi:ribosome-associated protein
LEGVGRSEKAVRARSKVAKSPPRPASDDHRPIGPKKTVPVQRNRVEASGDSSLASDRSREVATAIASAAIEKKAAGVEILDVAGRVDYADFLVIMTGRSDRHAQAIAAGIEENLKKKGVRALSVEGGAHGRWVLMDFGDVVVHVFQDEFRRMYDLDGLWIDARRIAVLDEEVPSLPEGG